MTHAQTTYILSLAVRCWDGRPRRQCAEDAWFALFSMRTMESILPEEMRNDFLALWSEYGGFSPVEVTRKQLTAWLDGLTAQELLRLEQLTMDFFRSHVSLQAATAYD